MQLNLAHLLPRSAANGPGERFVVWVQGCSIRCPGCWNPDTWSSEPRVQMSVDDLVAEILATRGIEGVTLTGGEPFEQAPVLASLCRRLRPHGLSVMAFTGYRLPELVASAQVELLNLCDIVVAGRYVRTRRVVDQLWRGSSNLAVHYLTTRYAESTAAATVCEVHLGPSGEMRVTGFPPDTLLARG